jgi:NAD(P)-dependent dehydrogenase (short-subunit alcohol dehydrogenase family)
MSARRETRTASSPRRSPSLGVSSHRDSEASLVYKSPPAPVHSVGSVEVTVAQRFEGKVVIVTGAGQGIGRAFALGFAGEGAAVVAGDAKGESAEETAGLIEQAGGRAFGVAVDVSVCSQARALIGTAVERFERLDVLINNAGVFPRASALELDEIVWDFVMGVNLKGTFLCSQAAARVMVDQGWGGRILSVSSGSAFRFTPRGAHYAASKAGIVAFSRNLAVELAPYQITVNVLAPGLTDTAQPRGGMTEAEIAAAGQQIPMGRIARPEDMVPSALFLCSAEAGYITGQTHHVNGGSWMP